MIYDKTHFEKGFIERIVIGNNMLVVGMDCSGIRVKFPVPWPELQ